MINIEQTPEYLNISYFDKSGNISYSHVPILEEDKFNWEYCTSNSCYKGLRSWDDKPIKKSKSTNYLNKFRIEEILINTDEGLRQEVYQINRPKKFYCDIETEVDERSSGPDAENAFNAVWNITFCNEKNLIVTLGFKHLSVKDIEGIERKINEHFNKAKLNEKITFKYVCYENEYKMLSEFFNTFVPKFPVLTGWYFVEFDWKYLVNRAKRLNIDISKASSSGKFIGSGQLPEHRIVVDYLELYKKWDRTVEVKENSSLDFVSQSALGISKVKFNGSFLDLYTQDFTTFIFYNAVDTFLVKLLDDKLQTMEIFLNFGHITKVEAQRAFSPVHMTEMVSSRYFYKRNRVMIPNKSDSEKKSFEGAFVFKPTPGIYKWLTVFDFASLYPSTIRQFNISPEAIVKTISNENDVIKTASGAAFSATEDSILRVMLADYYEFRKEAKQKYKEIEQELIELKKYLK